MLTLLPYTWRGRTYKTLRGLCTAVRAVHPGASVGFTADAMIVSYPSGSRYHYKRLIADDASIIEDGYIGHENAA